MKFVIDIEEFWAEDDESLSEALKKGIQYDVVNKIKDSISDQVNDQITKKVQEIVEFKIGEIIDKRISEIADTETIKPRHREEIPIVDYIKDVFNNNHGWSNADRKIESVAKAFGEELKLQYNNAFANQIVKNMKEQGLLKDEVVQILLENKKG